MVSEGKPVIPLFLGFVELSIVLGSVVTLFTIFVVMQFQYFFGGHTNINVEGFTYSEYARRGFGELVTVAFFALLMLLTFKRHYQTRNRNTKKNLFRSGRNSRRPSFSNACFGVSASRSV